MDLGFWAEREDGERVFFGKESYGFNFVSNAGKEPAMTDDVAGRGFQKVIEPEKENRVEFRFTPSPGDGPLTLHANLIYLFFVTPPADAKDRMQKAIIARIQASDEQTRREIVDVEVPARMAAMNVLESTNPPVVMATASLRVEPSARKE